jgi:hypothetical protein
MSATVTREVVPVSLCGLVRRFSWGKPLLFSELLLEGRKTVSKRTKSHMKLYLRSDVLAYMHYIGDIQRLLIVLVANTPTQKFSFYHLGKKSTLAIMNGMKTSNKPN